MGNWYEIKSGQPAKSEGQSIIYVTHEKSDNANVISNELSGELSPNIEAIKIPLFTAISLTFLITASLVTGIVYWYTAYYDPGEYYVPAMQTFNTPNPPPLNNPSDDMPPISPNDKHDEDPPLAPTRPEMDPLPEFVALWEENNNHDIVGRLVFADIDILVLQNDEDTLAWRLDGMMMDSKGNTTYSLTPNDVSLLHSEVDLLIGEAHNMVVVLTAPTMSPVWESFRAYLNYEFFLENPTITFNTLYGDFDWEIFSFYVAPTVFPFKTVNHENDEIWGETVEQFTLASLYNTRLDVTMYDQILTIATPTDVSPDLFYVLQARMLRHITS
ncbi:MAG: hypothetical protein FWE90_03615 [Defluviitaleaceae bacterium]|nr:hypothetical protein [Defluviitaleaceae bacterium]